MITAEQDQQIRKGLKHYFIEIEKEGFEHNYLDADIADSNILERAKERLVENLNGFELLNINLNEAAFKEQEDMLIAHINEY